MYKRQLFVISIRVVTPTTSTVADPETADAPEHVKIKEFIPELIIVTCSFPEIDFSPDQLPEAMHESALDDVQLRVMDCPTSTSGLFAESETDIDEIGSGSEFPPPPPQLTRRKSEDENISILFFMNIKILA